MGKSLVAMRRAIEPLDFPNGRSLRVVEPSGATLQMIAEAKRANDPAMMSAALELIVPESTEADWNSCTSEDIENVLLYACQRLEAVKEYVEAQRKNGVAGTLGPESGTRPSSPTMTSDTPAPASPAPSASPGTSSST